MYFFFLLAFMASDPETMILETRAVYFQDESRPGSFIGGVSQIAFNGSEILIRDASSGSIKVLDEKGVYLRSIGGFPYLKHPPSGMAVHGSMLWLVNQAETMIYGFVMEEQELLFETIPNPFREKVQTSNSFAADYERVVRPANPRSGHLGVVYGLDGEVVRMVGETLLLSEELVQQNPWIQNTNWKYYKGRWFCLFSYMPLLIEYNADFEEVGRIHLQGVEIDRFMERRTERLEEQEKKPFGRNGRFLREVVLNSDFDVDDENFYLLTRGTLYIVSRSTDQVTHRARFRVVEGDVVKNSYAMNLLCVVRDRLAVTQIHNQFEADIWFVNNPVR